MISHARMHMCHHMTRICKFVGAHPDKADYIHLSMTGTPFGLSMSVYVCLLMLSSLPFPNIAAPFVVARYWWGATVRLSLAKYLLLR